MSGPHRRRTSLRSGKADLADLIGAVYGASNGDLDWIDVGHGICQTIGAQRVYLGVNGPGGTLPNLLGGPDAADDAYAEYYHKIDPLRVRIAEDARNGLATPGARLGTDLVPRRELLRSEYYADYARRRGGRHSIGGQLDASGQLLLGIFRDTAGCAFDGRDLKTVQTLLPHLRRGLQLRNMLAAAQLAPSGAVGLAALEMLPQCVAVVDASMRIILANAAAERFFSDRGSGLIIRHSSTGQASGSRILTAKYAADSRALATLVANATVGGPGGAFRLHAPDESDTMPSHVAVLVSPLPARLATVRQDGGPQGLVPGLALVVARNLAAAASPPPATLIGLFGLTPGEAAVAAAVLGGTTAGAVAERRRVSLDTVRGQLQAVLRKSGAANLRDFERMAASVALMHAAAGSPG